MSVKQWHYGKLIILGIWSCIIVYLCLYFLEDTQNMFLGFILMLVILGIPVAFSIVTWKWLSGKENQ